MRLRGRIRFPAVLRPSRNRGGTVQTVFCLRSTAHAQGFFRLRVTARRLLFLAEPLEIVEQVHAVVGVRLRIDLVRVRADRGLGDEELLGDVLDRPAGEQVAEHLGLALRQPVGACELGNASRLVGPALGRFLDGAVVGCLYSIGTARMGLRWES